MSYDDYHDALFFVFIHLVLLFQEEDGVGGSGCSPPSPRGRSDDSLSVEEHRKLKQRKKKRSYMQLKESALHEVRLRGIYRREVNLCDSACVNACAAKVAERYLTAEKQLHYVWAEDKQSGQVKRLLKIMQRVHFSSCSTSSSARRRGKWIPSVGDIKVCKSFFIGYLGVNRCSVFNAIKRIKEGMDPANNFSAKKLRGYFKKTTINQFQKRDDVISMLNIFAKRYGDMMPDGVIRLPFKHQSCVYQHIARQFKKKYENPASPDYLKVPSYGYFVRIWTQYCPTIKLAREKGTHSMCTTCANFISVLSKDSLTETDREHILQEQDKHIKLQASIRYKYRHHINKALLNKDKYLSIIMDGFDGRKSVIPSFKNVPKDVDAGRYALKVGNANKE
jgi:hypothetical protein